MDNSGNTRTVVDTNGRIYLGNNPGKQWFVDTVNGKAANDGKSWDKAFLTMAQAFAVIASRDTIYFVGKVIEQIVAPLGVYGVTVIGADTTPRHDLAASWMGTGLAALTPLCEIREQGWRFVNILFQSITTGCAVKMTRAEDAVHPDPSHASFINCRFCGVDGIWDSGGCYNISIIGCKFYDLTGTAIKVVAGAGIAAPQHWLIEGCEFVNNASGIVNGFKWCTIRKSRFAGNTSSINLTGGTAPNFITDIYVDEPNATFNNTHGWTGITGDIWKVHCTDQVRYGIPTVA
jgi:hypothetical protein